MGLHVGYVYTLTNPSIKGFVKIGRTQGDPAKRARHLSTTGVPGRWVVYASILVPNCAVVERAVHHDLAQHRDSRDREFFKISPAEAAKAVQRRADENIQAHPEWNTPVTESAHPQKREPTWLEQQKQTASPPQEQQPHPRPLAEEEVRRQRVIDEARQAQAEQSRLAAARAQEEARRQAVARVQEETRRQVAEREQKEAREQAAVREIEKRLAQADTETREIINSGPIGLVTIAICLGAGVIFSSNPVLAALAVIAVGIFGAWHRHDQKRIAIASRRTLGLPAVEEEITHPPSAGSIQQPPSQTTPTSGCFPLFIAAMAVSFLILIFLPSKPQPTPPYPVASSPPNATQPATQETPPAQAEPEQILYLRKTSEVAKPLSPVVPSTPAEADTPPSKHKNSAPTGALTAPPRRTVPPKQKPVATKPSPPDRKPARRQPKKAQTSPKSPTYDDDFYEPPPPEPWQHRDGVWMHKKDGVWRRQE